MSHFEVDPSRSRFTSARIRGTGVCFDPKKKRGNPWDRSKSLTFILRAYELLGDMYTHTIPFAFVIISGAGPSKPSGRSPIFMSSILIIPSSHRMSTSNHADVHRPGWRDTDRGKLSASQTF